MLVVFRMSKIVEMVEYKKCPFSLPPENHSAPPDVTGYTNNSSGDGIQVERAPGQRQTPKYGNAELMETGDGESRLGTHSYSYQCNGNFVVPLSYIRCAITSQDYE